MVANFVSCESCKKPLDGVRLWREEIQNVYGTYRSWFTDFVKCESCESHGRIQDVAGRNFKMLMVYMYLNRRIQAA